MRALMIEALEYLLFWANCLSMLY